ncbi:MAG: hypothetical protein ACI4S9_08390 [Christensenellales bacterium]
MNVSGLLKNLFDYQRFEDNKRLQALIEETENRCIYKLSDEDLEWVSAAGEESDFNYNKDDDCDE